MWVEKKAKCEEPDRADQYLYHGLREVDLEKNKVKIQIFMHDVWPIWNVVMGARLCGKILLLLGTNKCPFPLYRENQCGSKFLPINKARKNISHCKSKAKKKKKKEKNYQFQ